MGRIARSFELVGQSYRILMRDKELMVLPLVSGVIMAVVVASFFLGFGLWGAGIERRGGPAVYVPIFLMYVVTYTIGIFFQAAVVAGATGRMRGRRSPRGLPLPPPWRRPGPNVDWAILGA